MRENSRHLTAFAVYVQLGAGRSQKRLRAALGERQDEIGWERIPSIRTLARWSSEFHWQERVDDLERAAGRNLERALADERTDALDRRRKLGLSLQQQGLEVLRERTYPEWSVRDALRAVEHGSAMEIEAIGAAPGDRGNDELLRRMTRRLEELTDDELKRLGRGAADGGASRTGAARHS